MLQPCNCLAGFRVLGAMVNGAHVFYTCLRFAGGSPPVRIDARLPEHHMSANIFRAENLPQIGQELLIAEPA